MQILLNRMEHAHSERCSGFFTTIQEMI